MKKKLLVLLFAVALAPAAYAAEPDPVAPAGNPEKGFFGKTWDGVKNGANWCTGVYYGPENGHAHRLLYSIPLTVLTGVVGYLAYQGYKADDYKKIWDIIKACVTTKGLKEAWETDKDLVIAVYCGLASLGVTTGNLVYGLLKKDDPGQPGGGAAPAAGGQTPQVGGQTPQVGGQTPQVGGQTPQAEAEVAEE